MAESTFSLRETGKTCGCLDWPCIYLVPRGSQAHGLYINPADPMGTDDEDWLAVVVPPIDYYYGLREFGSRGTVEHMCPVDGKTDLVGYEVRKFIRLLANGNPNVLSALWVDDGVIMTGAGMLLREHRRLFAVKSVYKSFAGYAFAQLRKMESGVFEGYVGAKRRAIMDKFQYDTKNASHCIRLLRMCCEFLADGEMRVDRSGIDRDGLLSIKRGEWALWMVKVEAERLFVLAKEARDKSPLPDSVDMDAVNKLAIVVVSTALLPETILGWNAILV